MELSIFNNKKAKGLKKLGNFVYIELLNGEGYILHCKMRDGIRPTLNDRSVDLTNTTGTIGDISGSVIGKPLTILKIEAQLQQVFNPFVDLGLIGEYMYANVITDSGNICYMWSITECHDGTDKLMDFKLTKTANE